MLINRGMCMQNLCPEEYHANIDFLNCTQEREDPSLTEWDRFAHTEYIRLSMEEDGEDASNGSADVYDEPFEAPY
jgi:hypothetical protein